MDYEIWIRNWLIENVDTYISDTSSDTDLLTTKMIDSFDFIRFAAALEDEFGVILSESWESFSSSFSIDTCVQAIKSLTK